MLANPDVAWALTPEQAQAVFDCLDHARKANDLELARRAFSLIDLLIPAVAAAKQRAVAEAHPRAPRRRYRRTKG